MKKLKITILYDAMEDKDKAEAEAKGEKLPLLYELVERVLTKRGHEVTLLAAPPKIKTLASQLEKLDSDLIFNLCESLGGVSRHEQNVAALLELSGMPFTGSGSLGLSLAQDKELSKKLLHFHGIKYPKFSSIDAGKVEWSDDLEFPLFVKPLNQDASIGIDENSVVRNVKELMHQISFIQTEFSAPALIEEYIEGREIYIGVLGNDKPEALPIIEWDFSKIPEGTPRIASAAAKWDEDSPYKDAPEIFPEDIPEAVVKKIQEAAVTAFKAFKLRDYARIDMRLRQVSRSNPGNGDAVAESAAADAAGPGRRKATKADEAKGGRGASPREVGASEQESDWEFFVIEVNPNPHLDRDSELAVSAGKHGLKYPDLLQKIIDMTLARSARG